MLEAYRQHVEERAAQGIPPKPLSADQVAGFGRTAEKPAGRRRSFPAGTDQRPGTTGCGRSRLRQSRFPVGDVNDEATSPLIDKSAAIQLLGKHARRLQHRNPGQAIG